MVDYNDVNVTSRKRRPCNCDSGRDSFMARTFTSSVGQCR